MAAARMPDTAFVPTMGAFHEGHLHLMREAKKDGRPVCVSLFVNPLQFGPAEDLSRYPRNEQRDFDLAEQQGVDVIFAPVPAELTDHQNVSIHVKGLTERWEGAARPGHFDGVATIVAKLFNIVLPNVAYFGWKDLQQCLVIRQMVDDLNMPVRLEFLDTVRESDGLAMSSRNAYLSPEEREVAPRLYQTLQTASREIHADADIDGVLHSSRQSLAQSGFVVDYFELVSLRNLEPIRARSDCALIVAAKLGTTRLIDNLRLVSPQT